MIILYMLLTTISYASFSGDLINKSEFENLLNNDQDVKKEFVLIISY